MLKTLFRSNPKWGPALAWLLVFLLSAGTPALAQVDTYVLTASQGTFVPLSGGTVVPGIAADGYLSGALPLGFSFVFDGSTFTSVKASSNGFLTFNPTSNNSVFAALTNAAADIRPLVAPLGDDLNGIASVQGIGSYLTTGTAPNRVFTFEWLNWEWRWSALTPVISFQAKLYEGTNRVEFSYRQEATPTSATSTLGASIGLAGVGTGAGSYLSLSDAVASPNASSTTENSNIFVKPATGQVYAFVPGAPVACPTPRILTSAVTGTSAVLSWSVAGGGGTFSIEYGPANFTPGAGTTLTSGTSSVSLSGLNPVQTYDFYVTQLCGAAGTSGRSAKGTFTTSLLNDDPCGAFVLPVGTSCTPVPGTNAGATTTTPVGYANPGTGTSSCAIALTPRDVWYTFSTPATGPASTAVLVQAAGGAASQLRVFSAASCAGPFTQIGCSSTNTDISAPALNLTGLTPATTYYLRVAGYGSTDATGPYTLCVSAPSPCADPTTLTVGTTTTTTAVLNFIAGGAQTFTATVTPAGGGAPLTFTGSGTPLTLTGLAPGTPYNAVLRGTCAGGGGTVILSTSFSTLITNDEPCTAIVVPVTTDCLTPTNATTVGATNTPPNGYTTVATGCALPSAPRDVWFSFTTAATGPNSTALTLNVDGIYGNTIRVFSAASCAGPFTVIGCRASMGAGYAAGSLALTGLTPATTYYATVAGYTNFAAQGPFTICALGLSTCPVPTAPQATTVTPTTAGLTWTSTAPAAGSTFTIEYGLQGFQVGSGQVVTATTTSTTLSGLTPDTPYCFYIMQNCTGTNGSSQRIGPICFQTLPGVPANDDPCGALALTVGTGGTFGPLTASTNVGATTTIPAGYPVPGCAPASLPKDVWFSFVAGSASATIRVAGAPAGQVRVFSAAACQGPFTELSCQASTGANTVAGLVSVAGLSSGTRYYVVVAGYGSSDATGAFSIQVGQGLITAVQSEADANLSLYPNPSHGAPLTLLIQGKLAAAATQVQLFNLLGQEVLRQPLTTTKGAVEQTLPTTGLPAGVYLLRVRIGETSVSRKVLID
jgi:hypothetical protein